ncbi:MAG: TIR domain-containing protein [Hyphomonadaceae bacterium]|nr:TIR domain-containing protein [Hyphomonadaceae bacterium]
MVVGEAPGGIAKDGAAPVRRYKAFFSYNHADRAIGKRLFNRVDGYRPPKALHGKPTLVGPVPEKLYPCFRDRDEEATAAHIRSEIARVLEASDHLVVLCSPNSAKSEWVAWEIETFQRLGRGDRIHAVVVDGNPEHVFPKALQTEDGDVPLAADIRREADGWNDGTLKLIAGLLGLGFGELKDREAGRARASRRLAAGIVGGFAFLFLGACAAGWVALDRSEKLQGALIQLLDQLVGKVDTVFEERGSMTTAEVEGDLGFAKTLTDAAFALAPDSPMLLAKQAELSMLYASHYLEVGRSVEALKTAKRAVDTADLLQDKYGESPTRERLRMITNNLVGDVLVSMGDLAGAKTHFEVGLSEARRLRNRYEIANTIPYEDLAISYDRLGAVALRQGDVSAADVWFRSALDVSEQFVKIAPKNPNVLRDMASSLDWVGDVAQLRGDPDEAALRYEESLKLRMELTDLDPKASRLSRDLVVSNSKLGDLAFAAGDMRGANLRSRAALGEAERLVAADPGSVVFQNDLSLSHTRLGQIAQALGSYKEAKEHYEAAFRASEQAAKIDAMHTSAQHALVMSRQFLGDLAKEVGDSGEAREHYQKGLEIAQQLVKLDPVNIEFRNDLAVSHARLADLLLDGNDLAGARAHADAVRLARLKLAMLDPANAEAQLQFAHSFDLAAALAMQESNPAEAKKSYESGLKIFEALVAIDPESVPFQRNLSVSYGTLGNLALTQNDKAGALGYYEKGLKLTEAVAQRDPSIVLYQRDLVVNYAQMAQATDDKAWWRKALGIVEKMAADGTLAATDKPWLSDLRQRSK